MNSLESHISFLKGPILVTGASGFIGANLFKSILSFRKDVYGLVQREKGWRLLDIDDQQIVAADLTDISAAKNLVNTLQPKTVFDCVSYGAYSFENTADNIYRTNFHALTNFIELLSIQGLSAYVHAGSSSEYGANSAAPLEEEKCTPNSHYSVSKVAASTYLAYMGKECGFPAVNLRLYSVYGPLEDTSRLVPNLLRNALQAKYPPFVNPNISRDFIYVDDVCRAFILAATKIHPDLYGESFNIGTGTKTSILELALLTKSLYKIPDDPQFGEMPARQWDLIEWFSNPNKAKKIIGWESKINLREGLALTAKYLEDLSDGDFKVGTKLIPSLKKRSISAVIACYKDSQAIPIMYERLTAVFKKIKVDYEIIFVNDASPDNSYDVILSISKNDTHVIGINHSRNFGSQMAFRSGMEIATKQSVVLLDGDLQDPPELIEQFYRMWEAGYDVVYGRRVKREMPFFQELLYKTFYRIFAKFSYIKIPVDAGDFSLIDQRVVGWMLSCNERDLFMRGIRAYVGFKQIGVDYVRPERLFGNSTNNFLKNIDWAKKGLFSFSNTPLTLLTVGGLVFLIISFIVATTVALLRIFFPDIAPKGATTILITILIFGSLNLFAIGLVGEYVAKIITEVKGRPRLIRASLTRNGESVNLLPDNKLR